MDIARANPQKINTFTKTFPRLHYIESLNHGKNNIWYVKQKDVAKLTFACAANAQKPFYRAQLNTWQRVTKAA